MAKYGRGTLYLRSGGKSWPVMANIRIDQRPDRALVTGTIEFLQPLGGDMGSILSDVGVYKADPNEYFLLRVRTGLWIHLQLGEQDVLSRVFAIAKGAHVVEPPEWSKKSRV